MSESSVYRLVYGMAVAPLGMGMLSLQLRRWTARLPLSRARQAVQDLCRLQGWGRPEQEQAGTHARGLLGKTPVHLHIGPDPGGEDGGLSVWVRLRIPRTEDPWPSKALLVDLSRGLVLRGDAEAGQAVLGSELGRFAKSEDLFEVLPNEIRFDRFCRACTHEDLAMLVSRVVHTWTGLTRSAPAEVLAQQVLHGAAPEVRVGALRCLVPRPRRCEESELHRELLLRALTDPAPEVRLEAGLRLGPDGIEVLRGLLEEDLDPELRLRAFLGLARQSCELGLRWCHRMLRDPSERVSLAVVEWAGHAGHHDELEALVRDSGPPVSSRVRAMLALESPDREGLFVECLNESSAPEIVSTAADLLGRVGGIEARRRLHGLLRRGASRKVIVSTRAALELLATRVRAEGGRVSLIDASSGEGALSQPRVSARDDADDPPDWPGSAAAVTFPSPSGSGALRPR
ncbi:MAG: HEAT repeat domain-containing protein [Myxococcota bacterium]